MKVVKSGKRYDTETSRPVFQEDYEPLPNVKLGILGKLYKTNRTGALFLTASLGAEEQFVSADPEVIAKFLESVSAPEEVYDQVGFAVEDV